MKLLHILLLGTSLLPFHAFAMDPYEIVEHIYDHNAKFSPGTFNYYKEGDTLSTPPYLPQKARKENALIYNNNSKEFKESALCKETTLYKAIPGQDGRKYISNTTTWPHCINTKLKMTLNTSSWPWGGSGTMVGPHHVLTAGHCVYDADNKVWFDEIHAYPALNGELAPFGELKITKAYIFKGWLEGKPDFDIALLLLDQSIGDYTGWGGLLSASDKELFPEEIHITGYPGDKGFKQMWGMSHKIKTMTSEKIYYEHDTQGGQSGCAISIKKYGMTFVAGVHTNGCGYTQDYINSLPRNTDFYGALVNSGVRISGKKFTDLLMRTISETYILNDTVSSTIFPSSIDSSPSRLLSSRPYVGNLQPTLTTDERLRQEAERQANIKKVVSRMDNCINQYKSLSSPNLTTQELFNMLGAVSNLYNVAGIAYEFKVLTNKITPENHENTQTPLSLPQQIQNTIQRLRKLETNWKNAGSWEVTMRSKVKSSHSSTKQMIYEQLILCIKNDLLESMNLYKEIYSHPHPQWEEFSKM